MSGRPWSLSDPSNLPPVVKIRCERCGRLIRQCTWDPRADHIVVLGSTQPEGSKSLSEVAEYREDGSRASKPLRARWRDHSADGRHSLREPDRYGFDCRGDRRGHTGTVTRARLEELFLDATRRGTEEIVV